MFEFLNRSKVYETVDLDKKNQIIQCFNDNNIDYIVRKNEVHHRSAFDSMKMGSLTIKPKYIYVIWVKKTQANYASSLIKSIY